MHARVLFAALATLTLLVPLAAAHDLVIPARAAGQPHDYILYTDNCTLYQDTNDNGAHNAGDGVVASVPPAACVLP
jgi:hypothetical protein